MAEQKVQSEIEENSYVEKIDNDQIWWRGPLHLKRVLTDKHWLMSMIIYIFIWISIASYVCHDSNPSDQPNKYVPPVGYSQSTSVRLPSRVDKYGTGVFGFALLSGTLTVLYIIMLHRFAKTFVWTIIYLVYVVLIWTILYLGMEFFDDKSSEGPVFVSGTILFIYAVYIFAILRKRIDIACNIIKEATNVLISIPSTLSFPLFVALLMIPVVVFTNNVYKWIEGKQFRSHHAGARLILHSINGFGFYWIYSFIYSTSYMILSMTFAAWYWIHDKNQLAEYPLLRAVKITFRYHLGTVALGSLITLICEFIAGFLKRIKKTLKSCRCCYYFNPIACICYCCFQLFLNSFFRAIKHLNSNAYIISAAYGTDFLTSASNASDLLMKNLLRVYAINKVSKLLLRLGQYLVLLFTLGFKIAYDTKSSDDFKNILIDYDGLLKLFVVSLLITELVFMVLKVAIDTMFLSVLEDLERNDGSMLKPYFMNDELKKLVLREKNPPPTRV